MVIKLVDDSQNWKNLWVNRVICTVRVMGVFVTCDWEPVVHFRFCFLFDYIQRRYMFNHKISIEITFLNIKSDES